MHHGELHSMNDALGAHLPLIAAQLNVRAMLTTQPLVGNVPPERDTTDADATANKETTPVFPSIINSSLLAISTCPSQTALKPPPLAVLPCIEFVLMVYAQNERTLARLPTMRPLSVVNSLLVIATHPSQTALNPPSFAVWPALDLFSWCRHTMKGSWHDCQQGDEGKQISTTRIYSTDAPGQHAPSILSSSLLAIAICPYQTALNLPALTRLPFSHP
uniref:Uncharacterized protein n=1 Tax=Psilocybe cubensis TaxID=181762 RepID=A0A8H7XSY0_PSICU